MKNRRGARGKVSQGWLAIGAVLASFAVGCGDSVPMGEVSGTVTLDGQPYTDASVMLLSPATGQGGGADIQSDGTFELPAPLPTGVYSVYLAPKSAPADAAPAPVTIDQSVPAKYWNESTTDITTTVNEGENTIAVELQRS